MKKSILAVATLVVACLTATTSADLRLTFQGNIEGKDISFAVASSAWDSPYSTTGLRNVEIWGGRSVSDWALFDHVLTIPDSYAIGNNYKQSQLIVGPDYSDFRYRELFNGSNSATQEYWSHVIDVRATLDTPLLFDGYVGVDDIFSYEERWSYRKNPPTSNGWTVSTNGWTTYIVVSLEAAGHVTLTDIDAAVVPVPSAGLLGALGLSCAGWRLRRRT